jgi:APA family basic amino acid/polyamine antiporter/amino acid efflux transporter
MTNKLGLVGVTSLALLNLLGTGMFFGPALSAEYAGTTALLVWLYLGLQSIYIGMMFSELTSIYPKAGGVYEFAKHAYGHFTSFLIGWIMWLVATVMIPTLIISALLYAFPTITSTETVIASLAIIIALSLVAYRGLGESEFILDAVAIIVFIFVIITVVKGVPAINTNNYQPFLTASPLALFVALFFILESYFGWEAVTFMAEETKKPRTTIPRALTIATILSSSIGLLFAIVLFGIMGADQLAQSTAPLYDVFVQLFGDQGGTLLRAGVFTSLVGSAAGVIISSPRLLRAMARDKLFIEQFSIISPQTGTPARAIILQATVASVVLFFSVANYEILLSILVPLASIMYIATFLAVPILRTTQPGPRPFNCPFPYAGPITVSLVFTGALIGWAVTTPQATGLLLFTANLIFFGVPIYFLLVFYYNPDVIVTMTDYLARLEYWMENIILPRSIRRDILHVFSDLHGKRILEFGSGVGTLTLELAERVGEHGTIFATDLSKNKLHILEERLDDKPHDNIELVHDQHQVNRVHPTVKQADIVISVGMLSYLQDVQKVLEDINTVLPDHGKVCFVDYVNYFHILPDPVWLKDESVIKQAFRDAGFSVYVTRTKGLFWDYITVYGFKSDDDVPFI